MAVLSPTNTIAVNSIDLRNVLAAATLVPGLLSGETDPLNASTLLAYGFEMTPNKLLLSCARLTNALTSDSEFHRLHPTLIQDLESRIADEDATLDAIR